MSADERESVDTAAALDGWQFGPSGTTAWKIGAVDDDELRDVGRVLSANLDRLHAANQQGEA